MTTTETEHPIERITSDMRIYRDVVIMRRGRGHDWETVTRLSYGSDPDRSLWRPIERSATLRGIRCAIDTLLDGAHATLVPSPLADDMRQLAAELSD